MGSAVFGDGTVPYFVLQFATFAILILAANTAFADFPRVSSILANDGFLPRQLANRGDRLVFSNGIIALAGVASVLIIAFGGQTSALIPLYAVGVFCGFTLSQLGMVVHHKRLQEPGWKRNQVINMVGCDRHVRRADRRRRVEVQPRRVDPRGPDSADRARLPQDQAALRPRRIGAEGGADRAGRAPLPHRRRADRLGEQGRAQRDRLRTVDAPRPARRDQRRDRRRGGDTGSSTPGSSSSCRSSCGPSSRPIAT